MRSTSGWRPGQPPQLCTVLYVYCCRLPNCWVRRLHALLAAPVLAMSSLSNFYFFAGTKVMPYENLTWIIVTN